MEINEQKIIANKTNNKKVMLKIITERGYYYIIGKMKYNPISGGMKIEIIEELLDVTKRVYSTQDGRQYEFDDLDYDFMETHIGDEQIWEVRLPFHEQIIPVIGIITCYGLAQFVSPCNVVSVETIK